MKQRQRPFLTLATAAVIPIALAGEARAVQPDISSLPPTCQETIAAMQGEKGQFGAYVKTMAEARKAKDTAAFCGAAREIVTLIKAQSDRLDLCVGELTKATAVPKTLSTQLVAVKAVYKNMLDATKNEKYDHFHCGLANQ